MEEKKENYLNQQELLSRVRFVCVNVSKNKLQKNVLIVRMYVDSMTKFTLEIVYTQKRKPLGVSTQW